jgi:hypothetical protein
MYETVIVLIAAGLTADLFWGNWTRAAVTGPVVDLGGPRPEGRCATGWPARSPTRPGRRPAA